MIDDTTILQVGDRIVMVKVGRTTYRCQYDYETGDWMVKSSDKGVQKDLIRTRDGAINFALERGGVIEDGNYERAPDRTSA
jgi:hypothetical protein